MSRDKSHPSADHADDLFADAMSDVVPLPADDKRHLRPSRRDDPLTQALRREAAVRDRRADPNPLWIPDEVPAIGPHDIVGHKKQGVQEGVYRKLRLGKYEVQGHLDLHRMTLEQARKEVWEFIEEAGQRNLRTLLITHGKGYHSPTPGRLKSYVLFWLDIHAPVLAWHSARPEHGGAGATYILIRKSEQSRRENQEKFRKGRV